LTVRSEAGSSSRGPARRERPAAILAWRFWSADDASGEVRLRSPFRGAIWPVGEPLVAECLSPQLVFGSRRRQHDVPAEHCRCGVYGGTYRELRSFLNTNLVRPSSSPVLGRVLLWGSVVAGESGWRASHGYPERLLVPTLVRNAYAVADALETYGAPVTIIDVGATFNALHPPRYARVD
jgi:hypothetical protein